MLYFGMEGDESIIGWGCMNTIYLEPGINYMNHDYWWIDSDNKNWSITPVLISFTEPMKLKTITEVRIKPE